MAKLVKFDGNWADEMDVSGVKVISNELYDIVMKCLDIYFTNYGDLEISVGTNEDIIYKSKECFLRDVDIKDITKEEYNSWVKIMGCKEFGEMPFDCDQITEHADFDNDKCKEWENTTEWS